MIQRQALEAGQTAEGALSIQKAILTTEMLQLQLLKVGQLGDAIYVDGVEYSWLKNFQFQLDQGLRKATCKLGLP